MSVTNTYQKTHPCCATCNNWDGAREVLGSLAAVVKTESPAVKGKCFDGPMKNQIKNASNSCQKWQKWSRLK